MSMEHFSATSEEHNQDFEEENAQVETKEQSEKLSLWQRIGQKLQEIAHKLNFRSEKSQESEDTDIEEDNNANINVSAIESELFRPDMPDENRSMGQKEDLIEQLPEDQRERAQFIIDNFDFNDVCPSVDRRLTKEDAFVIYDLCDKPEPDDPDSPLSREEILRNLGDQLDELAEQAREQGDAEAAQRYDDLFHTVYDQVTFAEMDKHKDMFINEVTAGSPYALERDIIKIIEREGYDGNAGMRRRGEIGGVFKLSHTAEVMRKVNDAGPDTPLEELYAMIKDNKGDTGVHWDLIYKYTARGNELKCYTYLNSNIRLKEQGVKTYQERATYRKKHEAAILLRSGDDLPDKLQSKLDTYHPNKTEMANRYFDQAEAVLQLLITAREQGNKEEIEKQEVEFKRLVEEGTSFLARNDEGDPIELTAEQEALQKTQLITREELANRFDQPQRDIERFQRFVDAGKEMLSYDTASFSDEVLKCGREDMPDVPDNISDYLRRNFGYNADAMLADTETAMSPDRFKAARLRRLKQKVEEHLENLRADARLPFGYVPPAKHFIQFTNPPARDEMRLVETQVLPKLDELIAAIDSNGSDQRVIRRIHARDASGQLLEVDIYEKIIRSEENTEAAQAQDLVKRLAAMNQRALGKDAPQVLTRGTKRFSDPVPIPSENLNEAIAA